MPQEKQYDRMLNTDITELLLKLSAPCILGLFIVSFYSLADAFFVARLGESEMERVANVGVVGLVFPVIAFSQAIGYILGIGGGCTVSRFLGEQKREEANYAVSFAIGTSFFAGVIIALSGLLFPEPILSFLGVKTEWMELAKQYASCVFVAVPFSVSVISLSSLLRAEGKTAPAMYGLLVAGGCNLALTPLFLFPMNMGIRGASLAMAISQGLAFLLMTSYYLRKKTVSEFSLRKIIAPKLIVRAVLTMGIPSIFRQGFAFVSSVALSRVAVSFGGEAVTASSVAARMFMVVFSIPLGIGQGYQPIVGYNDSANQQSRVRRAFLTSIGIGVALTVTVSAVLYGITPHLFSFLLQGNGEASVIAVGFFRFQLFVLPLTVLNTIVNMSYQAMGKKWQAVLLASLRQGLLLLPILVLLPRYCGLNGLQFAQAFADILTFAVTVPFGFSLYRKLSKKTS